MSLRDRPYMQAPRQSGPDRSQPSSTNLRDRSSTRNVPPPRSNLPHRLMLGILLAILAMVWSHNSAITPFLTSVIARLPSLAPPGAPALPTAPFTTSTRLAPRVASHQSRYAPYLNAINPASNDLRALAYAKTKTCPPGDKTCAIAELYRYVQHDIGYLSDPVAREYIQPPEVTLQIGAGDCEDLSILLSSLLENVGVPTYLVFVPGHAYALACQVDTTTLVPTLDRVYATPAPERVHEETLWLEPQTARTWNLSGAQSHTVSYTLAASEPIDWLVVPTADDAEAARQNRAYRTYPDCSREHMTHLNGECRIDRTAHLIARNLTNQRVRLETTLHVQDPPVPPVLPASFQTYTLDGANCLVLDPSIKGTAFPGQAMPAAVTATERIAVNQVGLQRQLP